MEKETFRLEKKINRFFMEEKLDYLKETHWDEYFEENSISEAGNNYCYK